MAKFKVTLFSKEEWDGELALLAITSIKSGRRWESKIPKEAYLASEEADMISEAINDGVKMDPNDWDEVENLAA